MHYITLHYITLLCITLYFVTLHYIASHCIIYYITLHCITLYYIILHYITLYYIILQYITLYYIILHITFESVGCSTCTQLNRTMSRVNASFEPVQKSINRVLCQTSPQLDDVDVSMLGSPAPMDVNSSVYGSH